MKTPLKQPEAWLAVAKRIKYGRGIYLCTEIKRLYENGSIDDTTYDAMMKQIDTLLARQNKALLFYSNDYGLEGCRERRIAVCNLLAAKGSVTWEELEEINKPNWKAKS